MSLLDTKLITFMGQLVLPIGDWCTQYGGKLFAKQVIIIMIITKITRNKQEENREAMQRHHG